MTLRPLSIASLLLLSAACSASTNEDGAGSNTGDEPAGEAAARIYGASGEDSPGGPVSRWRDAREVVLVEDEHVAKALGGALTDSGIPGAIGAIAHRDGDLRIGAFGVRKAGTDAPVTVRDVVHIGSDTKAMTAVLIARLVDRGLLRWDSTIGEVLPELAERIDPSYPLVTITQLLRHTSGAPANAPNWRAHPGLDIRARRIEIAADALGAAPASPPGSSHLYSNLGYMVAGAMAEAVADASWEELMVTEVFQPLGMAVTGFGVPGTIGGLDMPWGHVIGSGGVRPVQIDNDRALGPAGTVHLTVDAWARFALEFTDAAAGDEGFLSAESRARLLSVGQNDYAYGWIVTERPWAGGMALTHSGSNTTWFATVWVAPRRNKAYLVAANAAGTGVPRAVDRAIGALIALDVDAEDAAAKRGPEGER